jgi:hypothetical protein
VQQDLPHGEGGAGRSDEERQRVVAGPRSEADVEHGPDCEQRELDALQQAQGAGKLVQDELRGKGDDQD